MVVSASAASLVELESAIRKGIAAEPDQARLDYQQALAALRQLLDRAQRAETGLVELRPYARHLSTCAFSRDLATEGPAGVRGQCDCGFDAALDLVPDLDY